MNHKEFLKHLEKKYNISPKVTTSIREMSHHIDADTWFEWVYKWNIADLKFIEVKREQRTFEGIALWKSI